MNAKKILALMLGAMMLLSLAACGVKDNDKQADMPWTAWIRKYVDGCVRR